MGTPAHTALSVQQFLIKTSMSPMSNPPYSADLAPSNLFLFLWMKNVLKGKDFACMEEVKQQKKTAEAVKGIKINGFKNLF